jgi:hypothetical protein
MGTLSMFRRRDDGHHAGEPYSPWPQQDAPVFEQAANETIAIVQQPEPHGVARPEVLAAIVAQAEADPQAGKRDTGPAMALPPAPPAPPMPFSGVSAVWVSQVRYPEPDTCDLHGYARTLRHIGAATGTSTSYEHDSAWRLAPTYQAALTGTGAKL